jgi:hypothetical protein
MSSLTMFKVELAAHELAGGRWHVPCLSATVPGANALDARRFVVALAYSKAGGLPAWRPLHEASLLHTTASAV